ncbi:hypothetical protein QQS45_04635 [Alteriqipengyuania flavescens]|uniref:hypothetical protein n=1 Tax=Alteriqipengyuania flavescens TaxID=3053610 RepID=UPI0025B4C16A|nr:hypothetical protein [Alteriqipengyuania flavescens]WJY19513.1 hypothetical protein QQW98_04630 [Alteriqipengyuania flavescens]WJY25455.1 hypothetical protein QQS45_04635 [Alteriqipengyuania flavescens]
MNKSDDQLSREERLAAKLRENLHRRKAQARALKDAPDGQRQTAGAKTLSKGDSES